MQFQSKSQQDFITEIGTFIIDFTGKEHTRQSEEQNGKIYYIRYQNYYKSTIIKKLRQCGLNYCKDLALLQFDIARNW